MFSNFTVGLLAGLGIGAWVYAKTMRTTGGRAKDALIVAGATCGGVILLVTVLLGMYT